MADIRSLIAGDGEQVAPARAPMPIVQKTAPVAQASNNVDRSAIFQSEYAKAKARLAAGDTRAQGDIAALMREMKAIGVTPVEPGIAPAIAPAIAQGVAQGVAPAIAQGVAQGVAPVAAPVVAPTDARALIAGDGTTTGAPGGPPPPLSPVAKHFMDAFNTIRSNKPALLASTADVVAGLPAGILNLIGTASGRLTGETPEKSQQIGQAISSFATNPFGRLTGTTKSLQYQGLQSAVAAPFEYATNKIAQTTGMNPVDASLLVGAGTMALPEAKKFVAKNIAEAAAIPTEKAGRTTAAQAEQRAAANATAADQLQQQFAAKQAAAKAAAKPADFGAAYTTAAEPPLFKPPVELTRDAQGVYRDASGEPVPNVQINAGLPPERPLPGAFGEEPVAAEAPASVGAAGVTHENSVRAALAEARPDLQASLANKAPSEITPEELNAIQIHNKFAKVDPDFIPTEGQATQDIAKTCV